LERPAGRSVGLTLHRTLHRTFNNPLTALIRTDTFKYACGL
jgi:hypothetical protein